MEDAFMPGGWPRCEHETPGCKNKLKQERVGFKLNYLHGTMHSRIGAYKRRIGA